MGYWSIHPMGGDPPSDVEYVLDNLLFKDVERSVDLHWDKDEYKKRLSEKLEEATSLDYTRGAKTEEEKENIIAFYKQKVEPVFPEIARDLYRCITEDCSFILPFKIVELEMTIKDKSLSQKIKEMIKDGGAYQRAYDIPEKSSENYPKKENNWNNLETPFDYARKLYDLWDDIMLGKLPFDIIENDQGLFASVEEAYNGNRGNHPGIINKK